jgi:hypothetical protein
MFLTSVAYADEKSCSVNAKPGSDCEVVRTLTRCDVDKSTLRKKIYELEKKVKELQAKLEEPREMVVVQQAVYKEPEKIIKHSILGLYTTRDISGTNTTQQGNSAAAVVQTMFEPGIKYQYQLNFGLVPEIGINVKGNPLFGLGFEF